jgi:hypothetical protein
MLHSFSVEHWYQNFSLEYLEGFPEVSGYFTMVSNLKEILIYDYKSVARRLPDNKIIHK